MTQVRPMRSIAVSVGFSKSVRRPSPRGRAAQDKVELTIGSGPGPPDLGVGPSSSMTTGAFHFFTSAGLNWKAGSCN